MTQKVVLLDLENSPPTANLLRNIVEHYSTLYLFSCSGKFEYALEDLTEIAGWIGSGQVVILDIPETPEKEFEYAVIVGQLMALIEPETHIEVISGMPEIDLLMQLLHGSDLSASLIQIQPVENVGKVKYKIPDIEAIRNKPDLLLVKQYCDGLDKLNGKPNSLEKLKNSLINVLQISAEKAQHLLGMLINLKIVKCFDEQISIRKKVLKQWVQLDLSASVEPKKTAPVANLEQFSAQLESHELYNEDTASVIQAAQQGLFKNFNKIDPVQMEVIRKLHELKSDKPKDIYALRDLLEQMFPQSDVRLLLKELIEKGYIYWNGHEVLYSHEMFLN